MAMLPCVRLVESQTTDATFVSDAVAPERALCTLIMSVMVIQHPGTTGVFMFTAGNPAEGIMTYWSGIYTLIAS